MEAVLRHKSTFACALAALVVGNASLALAAGNLIGVYLDTVESATCESGSGPITCYVVASNVTDGQGVLGWQFALRVQGDGWIFSPIMPAQSINLELFPRMRVGCATPIPHEDRMVLMSFSAFAGGPTSVFMEPLSPTDPILILLDPDLGLVQPGFEYGGFGEPVFAMGGADCPDRNTEGGVVADEALSWGGVKSLYR